MKTPSSFMAKALNAVGPLLALILIWGLFYTFGNNAIGSSEGIESIVQQTVVIGIAAIGLADRGSRPRSPRSLQCPP
jgi:ribose/xylose/arabinose/galactoside ABC-type transport system permease subunit